MTSTQANTSVAQAQGAFVALSIPEQNRIIMREIAHLKILMGVIDATRPQPKERDLVLERLPSGEFAWLRADLTAKNRGPL